MSDWMLTVPRHVDWPTYERELAAVADWSGHLNYRVRFVPPALAAGDRMWVVYRGQVRGYQEVTGFMVWPQGFQCTTTGADWPPGRYIQRSGPFHAVADGPAIAGFRGVRRLPAELSAQLLDATTC